MAALAKHILLSSTSVKRLLLLKLKVELDNTNVYSSEHFVIGILLFLVLLLGGLVTILSYILLQEINYILPTLRDANLNSLSVYCEDLSLSLDEDFDTFVGKKKQLKVSVGEDKKYICSERNLTSLLNKIIERQLRLHQAQGLDRQRYLSCGNKSLERMSGDLTVSFSEITHHHTYTDLDNDVKLHWDKHEKHSYIHSQIDYRNGEIVVPEGRTYFVYASVHFNIEPNDVKDNIYKLRRFKLRLCRKVWGYEQTLLVKTTFFSTNNESITSSLKVSGFLHLNRNETLYVKVSNANHLILSSKGNTFGIYPM